MSGFGVFERGELSVYGLSVGGVISGFLRIFLVRESLVICEVCEGLGKVFGVKGV